MDKYFEKECYISAHPDPSIWRTHANYYIMSFYSNYIRGNVCDLGCNHGSCTLLTLDFYDQSKKNIECVYGFDMNFEALKVGFELANKANPLIPVVFMAVDLLTIPIESEKFDFAMSFHTLEHIFPDDVALFVKEIHRILKDGGHVLISIPYDHAYPDPAHVAFYTVDSICALFESNGFYTIEALKDNRWPDQKDLLTALFMKLPKHTDNS